MTDDDSAELEGATKPTAIGPELAHSLAAAKLKPLDAASGALAVRYAELMDEAVAAQKYVSALRLIGECVSYRVDDLAASPTGQSAASQLSTAWDKISSALAEHSVASDLGPKLLAAMTALNLTPAAREKGKPAAAEGEVVKLTNPLEASRDAARQRRQRSQGA